MKNIAEQDMTIQEARLAGVKAYQAGMMYAPCESPLFQGDFTKNPNYMELMKAYTYGWTVANLSDEYWDETMPSVIAYKEIMSNATTDTTNA